MNAISYCLFGASPMYNQGAIRNAILAKEFYPGWKTVFYIDEETVPMATMNTLQAHGGEIRLYRSSQDPNGMFVRFFIADDPSVDRFIIRDVDSRPCHREVMAVCDWTKSGAKFHVMRDHPYHVVPMLGGMWGAIKGAVPNLASKAKKSPRYTIPYTREFAYGADQDFLRGTIWPLAKKSLLCHDSCLRERFPASGTLPFPNDVNGKIPLGEWRFVGEVFDENDQPEPNHWQMRVNHMVCQPQTLS